MEKQQTKYPLKDIIAIIMVWLFALSMLYVVYLKMKLLHT